ncbi:MAG: hypothetical protein MZV64_28570 [Ignavibacteriales bacterium]|nr:hypothetical protein [Ignavibacteriales bacterium]
MPARSLGTSGRAIAAATAARPTTAAIQGASRAEADPAPARAVRRRHLSVRRSTRRDSRPYPWPFSQERKQRDPGKSEPEKDRCQRHEQHARQ